MTLPGPRSEIVNDVRRSLAIAWRRLRARPVTVVSIAVVLALGIGVNALMLSVTHRLVFAAPQGVALPDAVARVYRVFRGASERSFIEQLSFPAYRRLRESDYFGGTAAYLHERRMVLVGPQAERVDVAFVTDSYFFVLGVTAAAGRLIDASNLREQIAVVSERFARRVAAPRSVVGTPIRMGASVFTIVGVASREFGGIDGGNVEVWVPLQAALA